MESAQVAKSESDGASESTILPALSVMSRTVGWSQRTEWAWLEGETGLLSCWPAVEKLEKLLEIIPRRNICVQAGGALGIFPAYLARRFNLVMTFEPNPMSFRALASNVSDLVNVTPMQAALSDEAGFAELMCPDGYKTNTGAWYIRPGGTGGVQRIRLDDLNLPDLNLLMLDVEGHEMFALLGGLKTIMRYRPFILLEDKPKCRRQSGVADDWLTTFCEKVGYSIAGPLHSDQLLVPK